jgi:protein-tyrosine phosphatase
MIDFVKNLFGKKESALPPADLSQLKCDVHSHLLPGLDDGSKSMEESLELIRKFKELGYSKLITTPHVMWDYYKNSSEKILTSLNTVREAIAKEGIDIILEASAEYYLEHEFEEKIELQQLLSFGDNYVLFELPFFYPPDSLNSTIFRLQTNGYKPILAHPERYGYWHNYFNKYLELKEKGVVLQLNIGSLTGHYSLEVKMIAEKLIEEGMIELIGSDCHHINHLNLLEQARTLPYFHKLIESGNLINSKL